MLPGSRIPSLISAKLAIFLFFSCNDAENGISQHDNIGSDTANMVNMASDSITVLNSKANALLANGDTTHAMQLMEKSLSIDLNQHDVEAALCFLHAERKDPKALMVADRILRNETDHQMKGRAYFLKGIYYANIGDDEQALRSFDSSIITNFTFSDAYIEKSLILYDKKKYREATDLLNKAVSFSRFNPDIYFWLAKCHLAMGNTEEAIFNFEQTILLDSLNQEAKTELIKLKKEK